MVHEPTLGIQTPTFMAYRFYWGGVVFNFRMKRPFSELWESSGVFSEQLSEFRMACGEPCHVSPLKFKACP